MLYLSLKIITATLLKLNSVIFDVVMRLHEAGGMANSVDPVVFA